MTDSDYNTVRPIEGPPNVLGIAPMEQQQQQQPRKGAPKARPQHSQPAPEEEGRTESPKGRDDSNHLIDYRA
jgi:hypothetical protein